MKMPLRLNGRVAYVFALAAAVLVGLWLRCYLLADQVFIDDEWHGLYYVIGKSPFWLLTHFSTPGATCIKGELVFKCKLRIRLAQKIELAGQMDLQL